MSKEEYIKLYNDIKSIRGLARYLKIDRDRITKDFLQLGIEQLKFVHPNKDETVDKYVKPINGKKSPACGYGNDMLKVVENRVYDKKTTENLWDSVVEYQDAHNGQSNVCRSVDVEFDDDYLLIVFLADIHIGGESTLMRLLQYHLDELTKRKNLLLILCGDYTDNFITFAQNDQLIKPSDQQRLLEYVINTIKDQTIACCRGNHDERTKKIADIDMVERTCEMANIPYLGAEGWINLKVRDIPYTLFAAHQGRFNSALNPTHTVKKAFEMKGEFDVGVISHNHDGDIEQGTKWGQQRIYIRPGTYKVFDRYAINKGYNGTVAEDNYQVCTPSVLFFGDSKHMISFYNLSDALMVLDLLEGKK